MAKITVRLFASLRELVGRKELIMEAETLGGLLDRLIQSYGPEFEKAVPWGSETPSSGYFILINGRHTSPREKGTFEFKEGDIVAILPPIGGGTDPPR